MLKKIISLGLALIMLISVIVLASCAVENEEVTSSRLPITLNMVGITDERTTDEAIKSVEDAINTLTMAEFKTKINLTLVTQDEYYDLINERIEKAKHQLDVESAITQYNKYAQKVANALSAQQSSSSSGLGKWRRGTVIVEAETIATSSAYTKEITSKDENGNFYTVYPDANSPIDIVMILGKDMYDYFDSLSLLKDCASLITSGSAITDYKQFSQFIYPTYLDQVKAISGGVKAIPTNHVLAEYTYLLVNTDLAEKYSYNIDTFTNYSDLDAFLSSIKENDSDYVPFAGQPDPLGIFYPFGEDVAIATYFDPIVGYNPEESAPFSIQNLYDIPQYQSYKETMASFTEKGYFGDENSDKYAVKVVKGDKSIEKTFDEKYEFKIIQAPFVEEETIFAGMMGVTNYTSSDSRALEVIQAINTDGKLKNILQYGIENVNYSVNEDGKTITRLNNDYLMNTLLTGNLFVGYPEEGIDGDTWEYHKLTNIDSKLSPYLIYYVSEKGLEEKLSTFIYRAEVSEALDKVLGITYDEFVASSGTSNYTKYLNALKKEYKSYLLDCLRADGIKENALETAFNGNVKTGDWYVGKIALKVGENHPEYSQIVTQTGLLSLIRNKIGEDLNIAYSTSENKSKSFETYRTNAKKYYQNIDYLRIMVELLYDLTDEQKEQYASFSNAAFEEVIVEYVKENYIKEHDLSEEQFETLVKQYITSELSFYDEFNNSYTITWGDIEAIRDDSEAFIKGVEKLKTQYADLLANSYGFSSSEINERTPIEIVEELHNLLYKQYLSDNGYTMATFQEELYNQILEPFGITKVELDEIKRTNVLTYNNYISRIKSKYRNEILNSYSLEKYKDNTSSALTSSEILVAVLNSKIESVTNIDHTIASDCGLSYAAYIEGLANCKQYIRYVNAVRTNFIYSLRSYYTGVDINSIYYEDILDKTYEAVYNYGFYTNEMAKLVGLTLSEYSNNKSSAQNYITQLNKLIDVYEQEIVSKGYKIDEFRKYDPTEIESVIESIIKEKYFNDKIDISEYMEECCSEYIKQTKATNSVDSVKSVFSDAKAYFKTNYLFKAIIETLELELKEQLSE